VYTHCTFTTHTPRHTLQLTTHTLTCRLTTCPRTHTCTTHTRVPTLTNMLITYKYKINCINYIHYNMVINKSYKIKKDLPYKSNITHVSIPTIIHNSCQNIIVTNKKVQFYSWLKKQLRNNNYHSYISDSNSAPFWSCWEALQRIWPTYHRHISAAPNGYALTALNGSPHLGPPTIDILKIFLIIPNGSPSMVKKFKLVMHSRT
jgi:hypothetical protein